MESWITDAPRASVRHLLGRLRTGRRHDVEAGAWMLSPIAQAIHERVLASHVVQADDTHILVLPLRSTLTATRRSTRALQVVVVADDERAVLVGDEVERALFPRGESIMAPIRSLRSQRSRVPVRLR